jgi:hypothetical protein
MALAPDGTRGGRASRIAVFGVWAGAFDPIAGGPERMAAARGPGSVRSGSRIAANGPRFNFYRPVLRGQCCAASAARPVLRGHRAWLTFTGQCCAAIVPG